MSGRIGQGTNMANVDNPNGLTPAWGLTGGYPGRIDRFYTTDGTAIYVGGLVKPSGTADADGLMAVTGNVATGADVLGVVVGVEPVTRDSLLYKAATTNRYVYVCTDPNMIYEVQDDGAATPAATTVGNVADLVGFTSGDTATGRSAIEISMASVSASGDGSEDVIIIGLVQRPNNVFGVNANWLVKLNNSFWKDSSVGA